MIDVVPATVPASHPANNVEIIAAGKTSGKTAAPDTTVSSMKRITPAVAVAINPTLIAVTHRGIVGANRSARSSSPNRPIAQSGRPRCDESSAVTASHNLDQYYSNTIPLRP